ncbi:MAG: polymer-forming cytoskeletal protein [Terracidiphilus sp.]
MWNKRANAEGESDFSLSSEPVRPASSGTSPEPARPRVATADQGTIGKGILVKGDVTGSDPMFVDGRVEGAIHIPGERVTVGKNGTVVGMAGSGAPCITAREIVILGTVTGDIAAGERADIRAGGSLTGNISTLRVSIEDGAYFRGGIDIRREDSQTISVAAPIEETQPV